jgi:hypothetical protein
VRHRVRHHGFPLLVIAGLAAAAYLAVRTTVPHPVPAFALQAAAVYRLEVGAACFVVFYLATMALVLALDGRGFAEVGTKGLKAVEIVRQAADEQQVTLSREVKVAHDMETDLKRTDAALERALEALNRQKQRLEQLEEKAKLTPWMTSDKTILIWTGLTASVESRSHQRSRSGSRAGSRGNGDEKSSAPKRRSISKRPEGFSTA